MQSGGFDWVSVRRERGEKHGAECFFGLFSSLRCLLAKLFRAAELQRTSRALHSWALWAPYRFSTRRRCHRHRHHLFFCVSLTLSCPCSKRLWKVNWVMGAAVNQIALSKVMLCFTPASQKHRGAWHLSGCRSETRHPVPVTQTTQSLGRWKGWLVNRLSRNEVTPFC